jgi:hypothetical protein
VYQPRYGRAPPMAGGRAMGGGGMDGVNIYLGVGIVLVLAALVGQIEALGMKIPALRSRLLRLVLAGLGVASMVAAYIAPLPGTAATARKDRQEAYQRQVVAACDAITATRSLGDNALRLDKQGRVLRDPLASLLQRQVNQNQATLNDLWSQEVPEGLRDARQDAQDLSEKVLHLELRTVSAVRSMPHTFSQEQLDAVVSDLVAADSEQTWPRFRSAMSRLAGETCKLPA